MPDPQRANPWQVKATRIGRAMLGDLPAAVRLARWGLRFAKRAVTGPAPGRVM